MRDTERLTKLCDWTYNAVCKGREMKTPAPNMDITQIRRQEPKVFLSFQPMRPDETNLFGERDLNPLNVSPGIIIAPNFQYWKYMEEQRFDRYNDVHRPKEMGQSLSCQVMFFVYEDGVRLPGFVESAEVGPYDMSLIMEGTQEGFLTLMNWMNDFRDALLSQKSIPGTDMFLNEPQAATAPYADQKFIADRRPAYIGITSITFQCHADEYNEEINSLLR